MEINGLLTVITSILVLLNSAQMIIAAWKKLKPEVKNLEIQGELQSVSTANLSLEGASVSMEFLRATVEQLKKDLEAEKKARQEDASYFKRRVKEIDRELRDYRLWAARLAKQVIESGQAPVPLISSQGDSDPLINAINKEKEQLEKLKKEREKELNDTDSES